MSGVDRFSGDKKYWAMDRRNKLQIKSLLANQTPPVFLHIHDQFQDPGYPVEQPVHDAVLLLRRLGEGGSDCYCEVLESLVIKWRPWSFPK